MSDQAAPSSAPVQTPNAAPAEASVPANVKNATPVKDENKNPISQSPASKAAEEKKVAQEIRKMRLKIDGRDMELPEEEVVKWAQMGRSAQERFQEAAKMRKQAEQFISMLKTDPKAVLSDPTIGIDIRKFAEDYLIEQLQADQLTPEQKKMKEMEEKLRQHEEEKKEAQRKQEEQEFQKLQEHYAQDYEKQFMEALSTSGLPKTPYTVKRMAGYMSQALANGIDVTPSQVAGLVKQDYLSEVSAIFGQTDGDALLQILGDGVANKIRKADLARLKAGKAQAIVEPSTPPAPAHKEDVADNKGPMSIHEWREQISKRVKS